MIRNPTKHTVSGAKTDLRWACRNTLYGATFQAYQLYMASSRRPPHMRKAENSSFFQRKRTEFAELLAILLQNPSSNQKKTLRSAYFKPFFSVFIIRFSLVDRSLSKHQSKVKPPPLVIIMGVYSTRRTFPSLRVIVPSVFVKSRTVSFPLLNVLLASWAS